MAQCGGLMTIQPANDVVVPFDFTMYGLDSFENSMNRSLFMGDLGKKCHRLEETFVATPVVAPLQKGYSPVT
jgi:hypothetical protein